MSLSLYSGTKWEWQGGLLNIEGCVYCKQCTAHSLLRVHGSGELRALLPPRSNLVQESSSCAVAPHCTHIHSEKALISIKVICLFPIHQLFHWMVFARTSRLSIVLFRHAALVLFTAYSHYTVSGKWRIVVHIALRIPVQHIFSVVTCTEASISLGISC